MQAKEATWADVHQGIIVQDLNGRAWKVVLEKSSHLGLQDRDGEQKIIKRPPPDKIVNIMYLTQVELEAILVEQLGAEVEAWKSCEARIFTCKPFNDLNLIQMKSHLWLLHGVPSVSVNDPGNSAGMNSKKALIECHDAKHAEPDPERWTPHVHENDIKEW